MRWRNIINQILRNPPVRPLLQLVLFTLVFNTNAENRQFAHNSIVIPNVPFELEKPDFSGEAAIAMWLEHLGEEVDQDYVFDQAAISPSVARGLNATELADAAAQIGFLSDQLFTPLSANDDLEAPFAQLHADLLEMIPSVVLLQDYRRQKEKFVLVLGYDAESDRVIYSDPTRTDGAYRSTNRERFLEQWVVEDNGQFGVVRIRLAQGNLAYGQRAQRPTSADYAQHLMKLAPKIPPGFNVRLEPPFVIVSEIDGQKTADVGNRIVSQVVSFIQKDYFERLPGQIVTIWLFASQHAYRFYSARLFNIDVQTPYGFYSPKDRAIILDISTGGGTLVHEMIHPFMRANFEYAPPWFDEGLAALYERPTQQNGHLRGLPNWRLLDLKRRIAAGTTKPLSSILTMDENDFYATEQGANYAQAKYLCYYLQEQGLLSRFYHLFQAGAKRDPFGFHTLLKVTGAGDIHQLQQQIEQFVAAIPDAAVYE